MPTGNKVEVTLCLTDGTKLTRIEDLADITTFLEQHEEYVKIVRCKDCKYNDIAGKESANALCSRFYGSWQADDYCSFGERKDG